MGLGYYLMIFTGLEFHGIAVANGSGEQRDFIFLVG